MLNFKLATILISLAEMSKSKEGGAEAVMDFTRAARTIRDYTGDIAEAYSSGSIQELPGINAQVHSLIAEYLDTGKLKVYEDLKSAYSEDLINFVRISGLGKRRVFKIYDILGLKSPEDLYSAIKDRSIFDRVLKNPDIESGFITAGHIERLIFSFDYFEKTKKLFPKGYADFFIEKVVNSISGMKVVEKVQITGSLRRKKPFIHDIDLLVLPDFNNMHYRMDESRKLLREIAGLDFVRKLSQINCRYKDNMEQQDSWGQHGAFCSARYETVHDIDIEIIISSRTGWAFDLYSTTGSKSHIAAIGAMAKDRGFKLSGGGAGNGNCTLPCPKTAERAINNSDTFEPVKGDGADAAIYEMLGIEYIEPELRENNGEIEQAQNFSLPALVEPGDIKGDLHVHSYWSDGLIEMEDLLEKCRKYNYEYLAITDHSASNKYGNGLDEKRILEKLQYFMDFKKTVKDIRLMVGGEVDIRTAEDLDYDDDILSRIDFTLGSMHSNYLNSRNENTRRVVNAIKNRYVDGIAHPTGVVFGARAPYDLDIRQIFETAVRYDKVLEINSYLLRLDLNEEYVRQFKKMGGKIVINTDSHRLENIDMIKLGVEVARRAGIEKENVINTMTFRDLKNWKNSRIKRASLHYSS